MTVLWNRHRFSGGALVLDTTNTVVLRGDAARCFDRFDNAREIARFAEAATSFRSEELGGAQLVFDQPERAEAVIVLREAADRTFRNAVLKGGILACDLADLLRACAACLDGAAGFVAGPPERSAVEGQARRFETALAVSALALLPVAEWRRIRICPNCNWLFLDRSRNGSRLWCDMTVCGNRSKARRHYERRKAAQEGSVRV